MIIPIHDIPATATKKNYYYKNGFINIFPGTSNSIYSTIIAKVFIISKGKRWINISVKRVILLSAIKFKTFLFWFIGFVKTFQTLPSCVFCIFTLHPTDEDWHEQEWLKPRQLKNLEVQIPELKEVIYKNKQQFTVHNTLIRHKTTEEKFYDRII